MRNQIKLLLLLGTLLATLLLLLGGGGMYPHLYMGAADSQGVAESFRFDLAERGWTLEISLTVTLLPWAMAAIYYYVIDSVHFDRWWNWGILMLITALLCALIVMQVLSTAMETFQPGLSLYYASMLKIISGWAALLGGCVYTLASFGMRWWSRNCRHTPIPQ